MEEILASIRRIIADDEAKPEAAAPAAAAAPPPRAQPSLQAAAPKSTPPKPAAATPVARVVPPPKPAEAKPLDAAPGPAAKNSQDEIDAMLAGLDADTTPEEVRPTPPPPADDVFELTEQMALADPQGAFQTIEPQNDIEFAEPPPPPAPTTPPMRAFEERVREKVTEVIEQAPARPLMSHSTVAAVDSAFNALAQTVLSNNARTLEDLVKEMLRPMLKAWLDDNLPNLVEKIVRAEIERVSRGR